MHNNNQKHYYGKTDLIHIDPPSSRHSRKPWLPSRHMKSWYVIYEMCRNRLSRCCAETEFPIEENWLTNSLSSYAGFPWLPVIIGCVLAAVLLTIVSVLVVSKCNIRRDTDTTEFIDDSRDRYFQLSCRCLHSRSVHVPYKNIPFKYLSMFLEGIMHKGIWMVSQWIFEWYIGFLVPFSGIEWYFKLPLRVPLSSVEISLILYSMVITGIPLALFCKEIPIFGTFTDKEMFTYFLIWSGK